MDSSDQKGYHQIIQDHASHVTVIQLAPLVKSVSKMRNMPSEG